MSRKEKVRMFAVGDLCVYKGYVCRVEAVEREITGVNRSSLAYMGIPDGTELNPTLTMLPLYGPDGEPVKRAKSKQAASGAVSYPDETRAELEQEIARQQKFLALLTGMAP